MASRSYDLGTLLRLARALSLAFRSNPRVILQLLAILPQRIGQVHSRAVQCVCAS